MPKGNGIGAEARAAGADPAFASEDLSCSAAPRPATRTRARWRPPAPHNTHTHNPPSRAHERHPFVCVCACLHEDNQACRSSLGDLDSPQQAHDGGAAAPVAPAGRQRHPDRGRVHHLGSQRVGRRPLPRQRRRRLDVWPPHLSLFAARARPFACVSRWRHLGLPPWTLRRRHVTFTQHDAQEGARRAPTRLARGGGGPHSFSLFSRRSASPGKADHLCRCAVFSFPRPRRPPLTPVLRHFHSFCSQASSGESRGRVRRGANEGAAPIGSIHIQSSDTAAMPSRAPSRFGQQFHPCAATFSSLCCDILTRSVYTVECGVCARTCADGRVALLERVGERVWRAGGAAAGGEKQRRRGRQ